MLAWFSLLVGVGGLARRFLPPDCTPRDPETPPGSPQPGGPPSIGASSPVDQPSENWAQHTAPYSPFGSMRSFTSLPLARTNSWENVLSEKAIFVATERSHQSMARPALPPSSRSQ